MLKYLLLIPILVGCSTVRQNQSKVTVDAKILEHHKEGASSLEIGTYAMTKADFMFIRGNYQVSTNYYVSCGEVVEFVEIKW